MATSSIHKPGWRSRRRSRLSLVERAVPRLGRPVENGAKAARGDKTDSSSKNQSLNFSKSDASLVQAPPQPPEGRDHASGTAEPAPAATLEHASKYASARINDDDKQASPGHGETEAAEETTTLANDAAASSLSSDKPALARVKAETPTPAEIVPSSQVRSGIETDRTDPVREPFPPAEINAAVTNLVARIETEKADAARSSEQAPAVSSKLELDWDRLIDSGFTDPRDRSRPLPKKMDEIVRALIRQALSDQSSWRDRVILVTSPYDRRGKTTAAINFAFGLTTVASHHVVLVDVDTAGSGAVDRLGGGDRTGITAALVDETIELDEVVIKTNLERLTLVASGPGDEETLDRFASRRMLQILRHLTENPDTILIIDAPPILLSQEAAVLSVIAGQVVLAVEAGRTTGDQIEHALQRIGERHNVSLVLNECSGIIDEDIPKIAHRPEPETVNRRTPSVKRRLPRAAAVASAVMLCLLVLPTVGQTSPNSAVFAEDLLMSPRGVLPPERCSSETEFCLVPCHRMCR